MELADKIIAGDVQAAARLISQIEDEVPGASDELDSLFPYTGKAFVIGVTGPPGAGKSSLIDSLVGYFRSKDLSVGVIAIDPSSAITGGAILGDRVRMQRHNIDKGVFIRSLATRGWVGGLAKAAIGAIHIMDAMKKDIILVETVGTGQIEIDIVKATDTTIIILTPNSGDDIQMMKAGILEAVDVFVVNKADMEGAERVQTDLEVMLMMKNHQPGKWEPSIVLTEAIHDKGIDALAKEIFRHRDFLASSGGLEKRQRDRVRLELIETIESILKDCIHRIDEGSYLEKFVDDLMQGKTTPHRASLEITTRVASDLCKLPYAKSDKLSSPKKRSGRKKV
jgi:LAO/AO transport system kinase